MCTFCDGKTSLQLWQIVTDEHGDDYLAPIDNPAYCPCCGRELR